MLSGTPLTKNGVVILSYAVACPIFALLMFSGLDLVLLSLNHIRIEIRESNFRSLVMVGFADENKTVTITYQICIQYSKW